MMNVPLSIGLPGVAFPPAGGLREETALNANRVQLHESVPHFGGLTSLCTTLGGKTVRYNWCHKRYDASWDRGTTERTAEKVSEAELAGQGTSGLKGTSIPKTDPKPNEHSMSCCGLMKIQQGMTILRSEKRGMET